MNAHNPMQVGAQSVATLATDKASRYLQQLAKHFAHKLPVTFDPQQGKISFSVGDCDMIATEVQLVLTLTSPDAESLAQLENVVERHLVRFAFREELTLDWQPVKTPAAPPERP
ncbi:DUF2218 domain-containing protein [soil metagenome]